MTELEITKLKQLLGGKVNKPLFLVQHCKKCGSTKKVCGHHITYVPEKIAPLCSHCHAKITVLNTATSIATGINKENDLDQCNMNRRRVWKWFLRKRRPVSIANVLEFLGVCYDFDEDQLDYIEFAGQRCL